MDVKANRVSCCRELKNPGDFCFIDKVTLRIVFVCPCGTHADGYGVRAVPLEPCSEPHWDWDGNRDEPSLTPSLQDVSSCRWHGYLTKGVFRRC